jgi:hypothetical protein
MSKKTYIETEHTRIPFYRTWWTFGWGLFNPLRIDDLISATNGDRSEHISKKHALSNTQHAYTELSERHKALKLEFKALQQKVYFIPPQEGDPGESWEDVSKRYMEITGMHNQLLARQASVLIQAKAALEANATKAKKAGKPYKWMLSLVDDIKACFEATSTNS